MATRIVSEVFCCGECAGAVALAETPGGELAYECLSPRCRKVAHVNCPEALALIEDVAIELPALPALEPINWPLDTNGRPLDWYAAKDAVERGAARRWQ